MLFSPFLIPFLQKQGSKCSNIFNQWIPKLFLGGHGCCFAGNFLSAFFQCHLLNNFAAEVPMIFILGIIGFLTVNHLKS